MALVEPTFPELSEHDLQFVLDECLSNSSCSSPCVSEEDYNNNSNNNNNSCTSSDFSGNSNFTMSYNPRSMGLLDLVPEFQRQPLIFSPNDQSRSENDIKSFSNMSQQSNQFIPLNHSTTINNAINTLAPITVPSFPPFMMMQDLNQQQQQQPVQTQFMPLPQFTQPLFMNQLSHSNNTLPTNSSSPMSSSSSTSSSCSSSSSSETESVPQTNINNNNNTLPQFSGFTMLPFAGQNLATIGSIPFIEESSSVTTTPVDEPPRKKQKGRPVSKWRRKIAQQQERAVRVEYDNNTLLEELAALKREVSGLVNVIMTTPQTKDVIFRD